MWEKGEQYSFAANFIRNFFYPRNDLPVSKVYAVKSADGNHRIFDWRKFFDVMVYLHFGSGGEIN